uniref:M7GpppX diphosphatase n=1 Tax=Acrobeloides nanus TaxID=290746 RepID=A0A914BZ55_9BILA
MYLKNCKYVHDENELNESWAKLGRNPQQNKEISPQQKNKYLVDETAEDYEKITLPYIQTKEKGLIWVYDILDYRAEQDRVVFEDPDSTIGFVLIPPRYYERSFHLLAIVRQCGIKSIRDLTAEHIPLLENIKHKSSQVIKKKFGFESHQLKFFFHYQPSYYHLHVHIQLGTFIHGEKDVMLEDVIKNLLVSPDFYKKTTLRFIKKERDSLLKKFREVGKGSELFKK